MTLPSEPSRPADAGGPSPAPTPFPRHRSGQRPLSVFLGQVLIEEGVLQPDDLRVLIQRQKETPPEKRQPIGNMAVEANYLDQATLLGILDRHASRLRLGELLVMRGLISLQDLTRAMEEQAGSGGMIGEILLRLQLIDPGALAEGLAEQCGIAYIPIRNIPAEPGLIRWINPGFARLHEIVPVACQGRNLVVAVWQPRSLAVVLDVEQATGLHVSVVLTTRHEIEERLLALYGPAPEARAAAA